MKKHGTLLLLLICIVFCLTSCRRYGCTDPAALNYSNKAKKDDGSCIQATQVYIEEFTLTFDPSTSHGFYFPAFHYQQGDLIVVEALSDDLGGGDQYWTALPFVNNDIVFWNEYGELLGDIWVYADYVSSGEPAEFLGTVSVGFRAALIKKQLLEENPGVKGQSIDDLVDYAAN